MKKKWLSKVLSIMLVCAMLAGVTACGKDNAETTKAPATDAPTTGSDQPTDQSTEESTEAPKVEVTYPLKTDVSFVYFTATGALKTHSSYENREDSPFHQTLVKNTGVSVDWQSTPKGANATTTLNLLLSDPSTRPEVFDKSSTTPAQRAQWAQDGVILELTDLLPEYAPDFWEFINLPENEIVKKSIMDDEGRIWFVPTLRESGYNITYTGPMIRKDWLDACNLDVPVTIDDMEKVLIAFKDKYGVALGGAYSNFKKIGFGSGTGAMTSLASNYYVDDNGTIQYANVQPEWKEYLEYLHRWYEKGLIDPDFFSANNALVQQKVAENKAGVVFAAMSQLTKYINDAETNGSSAEWIGMEYLRTAAGEPTSMIQTAACIFDNINATFISGTIDKEKIPVVLNWLNYFFTEEGINYANFGVEGEHYTMDEKGEIQWTELITKDELGTTDALLKYTGWSGTGLGIQKEAFVRAKNHPTAQEAVYKWIENTKGMEHSLPVLSMTEDESMAFSDTNAGIATYVEETALKFVTGEKSLDEFDSFVAEVYKLGLQDCLDAQNAAYERFKAR